MAVASRLTNELIDAALAHAVRHGESGIQVAAFLHGEPIVNSWTGVADPRTGREVAFDTLFPVFSVTKAVTAAALHIQSERGLIDYDAPLSRYWPAYGSRGKQAITVRQVLTHRAGVPQLPPDLTVEQMCDWRWMVGALEQLEPLVEPDTRNVYHTYSFGWLLGEVIR